MRATRVPARFSGALHLDDKPLENSPAGIILATQTRRRRIDLDSCQTADNAAANTHYPLLSRDRFLWTKRSEVVAAKLGIPGVKAGQVARVYVHDLPFALVATVHSAEGHHPIRSMGQQIPFAAKKDVDVEWEPKDVPPQAVFNRIARTSKRVYGDDWREHVLVKRLVNLPGWRLCLDRAKAAGFYTIAINIDTRNPRELPDYVDYYRR